MEGDRFAVGPVAEGKCQRQRGVDRGDGIERFGIVDVSITGDAIEGAVRPEGQRGNIPVERSQIDRDAGDWIYDHEPAAAAKRVRRLDYGE